MASWDGLNRRKFPRVNYPCLVVIRGGDDNQDVILTHTENVGVGGVCVILKQDIKMFSAVDLEVDLLDLGDHIKCKGKVVWNVQRKDESEQKPLFYDIGVEFQDLEKEENQRLEEIVDRLVRINQEKNSPS
jgi:Tfp pilus assembly protein PilZ